MQGKIVKLLLGFGVVAALVVGATQLAGAQGNEATTSPRRRASGGPRSPTTTRRGRLRRRLRRRRRQGQGCRACEGPGKGHGGLGREPGRAGEVEKADPGDPADPAYEAQIAYDVEVTKADGSAVDVHLDNAFTVLGTSAAHQDRGDHED